MILMNLLSRVMFNDRMTPLDYDIFYKVKCITGGRTIDKYDFVLMVDADTVMEMDSVKYMVRAMNNDPSIMGLCGETKIANKISSWVTMIQVFEYFISHHLNKSFESVFGGVSCLPGCFCLYRIKFKTAGDKYIPVLVNPDIVEEYSENSVQTLHEKNLLLLGEDRFLTTLLLRQFPKRRMIFLPQAICHTDVPESFAVLLSQRRRWINSTVHNLWELMKVKELCGVFCFSMQFVIVLDLIGTLLLPAAVILLGYFIASTILWGSFDPIAVGMVIGAMALPGVVMIFATGNLPYLAWMAIYIIAIPIWNFLLPIYAFSKFDDFTWGETRKVVGDLPSSRDHLARGSFLIGSVPLKR